MEKEFCWVIYVTAAFNFEHFYPLHFQQRKNGTGLRNSCLFTIIWSIRWRQRVGSIDMQMFVLWPWTPSHPGLLCSCAPAAECSNISSSWFAAKTKPPSVLRWDVTVMVKVEVLLITHLRKYFRYSCSTIPVVIASCFPQFCNFLLNFAITYLPSICANK